MSIIPSTHGFSLTAKLILGFLLVTVPSVLIIAAAAFYAFRELTVVNRHLQEISRSLEVTRHLEASVRLTMLPPSRFLISGAPEEQRQFSSLMGQVETQLQSCAGGGCHGASRPPRVMAEALAPNIQGIKDLAAAIFGAGALTENDKARLLRGINVHSDEVNRQLDTMSTALLGRVDQLQRKSQEVNRNARNLIVVFTFSVLSLVTLTAYFVSRRFLRPVRELLLGTRHVTEGDLGYRVAIAERDEIGELGQSFNRMTEELQQHRERLEEMVRDKTEELKRAQESLLQTEKLASIGLLASGVAHEINNPLTSILMNVNLLMEEAGEDTEVHRELKRIGEDALRCKRIIDDLRDFSGRHQLEIRPFNLNEVLRRSLGLVRHQLDLHEIALRESLAGEIPLTNCDPDRMEQVFMNVLLNAIQAMPQGGTLTISSARREECVEIAIQDTGPGIPDEIRGKIFDPFFTTKQGGTGLGLSIVYRIMEEHGGRVEIETRTQEESGAARAGATGTTVRLFLPSKGAGRVSAAGERRGWP